MIPLMSEPTPVPSPEESDLVRQAQSGDLHAFTLLVRRHQGAIRAYLAVRLNDSAEAEDLAQDTFLTAYRKLSEYDPTRPLLPWLRGIAHRLLQNHGRKFRALPLGGSLELQSLLDVRLASEWPLERDSQRMEALLECLDRLDGPGRQLLQARYAEGLSLQELAQRSGRKHSALTMHLHRLRSTLASCVHGKIGPDSALPTPLSV